LGSFAIAQNPHFRSKALLVNSIQKSLGCCWYLIIWLFYEIVFLFCFCKKFFAEIISAICHDKRQKERRGPKKSMFF
jgi:hypothetical protein